MGVTGIGGFFFRAKDPAGLAAWYAEHLGIGLGDYGMWDQQAGPTVFSPYEATTDQIPSGKEWKLNLRVDRLDELKDALESAGVAVITNPDWDAPGVGRFVQLHDPEGNLIELWEPD
jgi:predicted enzyme related to lactoylglutathione lyase